MSSSPYIFSHYFSFVICFCVDLTEVYLGRGWLPPPIVRAADVEAGLVAGGVREDEALTLLGGLAPEHGTRLGTKDSSISGFIIVRRQLSCV